MESTFIWVVRCWAEVNGVKKYEQRGFDNFFQACDCAETWRKVFGADQVKVIKMLPQLFELHKSLDDLINTLYQDLKTLEEYKKALQELTKQ